MGTHGDNGVGPDSESDGDVDGSGEDGREHYLDVGYVLGFVRFELRS